MKKMENNWQKEVRDNKIYLGKLIAISNNKVIDFAENYEILYQKKELINKEFSTYFVPKNPHAIRILTFKIRSLKQHEWEPLYTINF